MTAFQWNQSHVTWLVKRFKNEARDIVARDILDNYNRRKGEARLTAQDCRTLMRQAVQHKQARVISGCVDSKHYKIRLVSSDYPYIQKYFDKELFDSCLLDELLSRLNDIAVPFYQDDEMRVTDEIPQRMILEAYKLAIMYQNTCNSSIIAASRKHDYNNEAF